MFCKIQPRIYEPTHQERTQWLLVKYHADGYFDKILIWSRKEGQGWLFINRKEVPAFMESIGWSGYAIGFGRNEAFGAYILDLKTLKLHVFNDACKLGMLGFDLVITILAKGLTKIAERHGGCYHVDKKKLELFTFDRYVCNHMTLGDLVLTPYFVAIKRGAVCKVYNYYTTKNDDFDHHGEDIRKLFEDILKGVNVRIREDGDIVAHTRTLTICAKLWKHDENWCRLVIYDNVLGVVEVPVYKDYLPKTIRNAINKT